MTYLDKAYQNAKEEHIKKSDRNVSELVSDGYVKNKTTITYLLFTTTSIIMGILILSTILAVISRSISHTTILVDVLMIIWHLILIVRISLIEKELDSKEVNPSDSEKKEAANDMNIEWI